VLSAQGVRGLWLIHVPGSACGFTPLDAREVGHSYRWRNCWQSRSCRQSLRCDLSRHSFELAYYEDVGAGAEQGDAGDEGQRAGEITAA
jgi:hypothetical protein